MTSNNIYNTVLSFNNSPNIEKGLVDEENLFNHEIFDRKINTGKVVNFSKVVVAETVNHNNTLDYCNDTCTHTENTGFAYNDFERNEIIGYSNNHMIVGENIKYLSEIPTFVLPKNKIFCKGITGCGGTTEALTNDESYYISMPYAALVQEKAKKHGEDVLEIYKNTKPIDILNYIKRQDHNKKPLKIVGTYDSMSKLIHVLDRNTLSEINLLVDEYHILRGSYSYRSNAVQDVLRGFEFFKSYCFMSATDIPRIFLFKKLQKIDSFSLHWPVQKTGVEIVNCTGNQQTLENLNNWINQNTRQGKNCYVYLNSLKSIQEILKNNESLNVSNTKIIYSKNNDTIVKDCNENAFSRKPLTDITPITFLTATGFEGRDIEDSNGISAVVSMRQTQRYTYFSPSTITQIIGRNRSTKERKIVHFVDFKVPNYRSAEQKIEASLRTLRQLERYKKTLDDFDNVEDRKNYYMDHIIGIDKDIAFLDDDYTITITDYEKVIQESYHYFIDSLYWEPARLVREYESCGYEVVMSNGNDYETNKKVKTKRQNKLKQLQALINLHGKNYEHEDFEKWFSKNTVLANIIRKKLKTPHQIISEKRTLEFWRRFLNDHTLIDNVYTKIIDDLRNNKSIKVGKRVTSKQWYYIIIQTLVRNYRTGHFGIDNSGKAVRRMCVEYPVINYHEITEKVQMLDVKKIDTVRRFSVEYAEKLDIKKLTKINNYLEVEETRFFIDGERVRGYYIDGFKAMAGT